MRYKLKKWLVYLVVNVFLYLLFLGHHGAFADLDDFIDRIEGIPDVSNSVLTGVRNRVRIFPEQSFLSRDQETPLFNLHSPSLVKPNQISIFSLGGLGLRIQQAAVSQLLRKLFNGAFKLPKRTPRKRRTDIRLYVRRIVFRSYSDDKENLS